MKRLDIAESSRAERIVWREILRSDDARYDHRLHGILVVCKGMSCYEAAAVWGRSPRTVEYWVRRFNAHGLAGLREGRKGGRPSRLRAGLRESVRVDLGLAPGSLGYQDRSWTGRGLSRHLTRAYGVRLGVRQCQRLLRRYAKN